MLVLGIETSCDETSVAILELVENLPPKIIAEEILSQTKIHIEYGGVVPELAAREHLTNLPFLWKSVLTKANCQIADLDLIAVTTTPGLKGCLLMGVGFAEGLSVATGVSLVGAHHIEGHILAAFLNNPDLKFPYLALVVSGGHTQIVNVQGVGEYQIIAETIDDAAGEAFDKSAHLLGFSYPGGPQLAALADSVASSSLSLPAIMKGKDNFSFSGLKTAVSLEIKKIAEDINNEGVQADLAHGIQKAINDHLLDKLQRAIKKTGINRVVVTGGVAANKSLRRRVGEIAEAYFPDILHSMDNAAMIALVAGWREMLKLKQLPANQVYPRKSIEELSL